MGRSCVSAWPTWTHQVRLARVSVTWDLEFDFRWKTYVLDYKTSEGFCEVTNPNPKVRKSGAVGTHFEVRGRIAECRVCQLPVLAAVTAPLFAKRLGCLLSRLAVPKPPSLQRAPVGQGSFVLPWLAGTLQQLRAPMAGRDPPGFWSLRALAKARRERVFVCLINHHRNYSVYTGTHTHTHAHTHNHKPSGHLEDDDEMMR